MAKRRAHKRKRKNRRGGYFWTVICIMALIAGCLYFVYGMLEVDYVREVNENLRASFHATPDAATDTPQTAAPTQAPSAAIAAAALDSGWGTPQTAAPTQAPAVTEAATAPDSAWEAPQTDAPTQTPAVTTAATAPDDSPEAPQTAAPTQTPAVSATPLASEGELNAAQAVASAPQPTESGSVMQTMLPSEQPRVVDIPIEEPVIQPAFEELYAQNNDLVGWIEMADSVDYPVLWRDNSYYMDHDFYGDYSQSGSIFLDARNNADMSDSHILIYGHNMRSGEMFGDLDRYRQQDYLCEYPIITLQSVWESEPRTYVLISLFDASMNKDDSSYIRIIRTAFEDDADKEAFIAEMRERSIYDIPVEADAGDQLLTLVTCSYSHDNGRFLLFARELREDETVSDIMEQFQQMS